MNRKGFTLIELIIVITLIAMVSLLATPNVIQMVENGNKDKMVADANNFLDDVMYKYSLEKYKDFYPTENCSCKVIKAENSIFAIDLDKDYAGNSYDKVNSSILVCLDDNTYKYYIKLVSKDENGYVNMISNKSDAYEYVSFEDLNRSKVKKFKGIITGDLEETIISPTCVPHIPEDNELTCTLQYDGEKLVIQTSSKNLSSKPYKFNNEQYSAENTKSDLVAGTYTAKVKDESGKEVNCDSTITLNKFTATFNLNNKSLSICKITLPTDIETKSCLTTGTSCNITTPNLVVEPIVSTYTCTAKGWSNDSNATTADVNKDTKLTIEKDEIYYSVITSKSSNNSPLQVCVPGKEVSFSPQCTCERDGSTTLNRVICNSNGNGYENEFISKGCDLPCGNREEMCKLGKIAYCQRTEKELCNMGYVLYCK